jgi:ATP-binding cassette, subfamily C, bacteriocin exporter
VLESGKVAEEGAHHSLLKAKGQYYSLWKNQFPEMEMMLAN